MGLFYSMICLPVVRKRWYVVKSLTVVCHCQLLEIYLPLTFDNSNHDRLRSHLCMERKASRESCQSYLLKRNVLTRKIGNVLHYIRLQNILERNVLSTKIHYVENNRLPFRCFVFAYKAVLFAVVLMCKYIVFSIQLVKRAEHTLVS